MTWTAAFAKAAAPSRARIAAALLVATVIAVVHLPRRETHVYTAPAHGTVVHVETIAVPVVNSAR